jgi:hypothetical protein
VVTCELADCDNLASYWLIRPEWRGGGTLKVCRKCMEDLVAEFNYKLVP